MSPGNASVVKGLYSIMNPEHIKSDIDAVQLEKMLSDGGLINKTPQSNQERFKEELEQYGKNLGIDTNSIFDTDIIKKRNFETIGDDLLQKYSKMASDNGVSLDTPVGNSTGYGQSATSTGYGQSATSIGYGQSATSTAYNPPEYTPTTYPTTDYSSSSSHSGASPLTPSSDPYSYFSVNNTEHADAESADGYSSYSNQSAPDDFDLLTQEEQRRRTISSVNSSLGIDNSQMISFEEEKREDTKYQMLEEIESIMEDLDALGVNIARIRKVDHNSSFEDVRSVWSILRHKNDRLRYCSLAEEGIMFMATTLEDLCNGERMWFGRYQPDLTGWHHSVGVKLRRMRTDTSSIVGNVMQEYNIGPGLRIALELIPNMLMYSRNRKDHYNKPGINNSFSDSEMAAAANRIRDAQ